MLLVQAPTFASAKSEDYIHLFNIDASSRSFVTNSELMADPGSDQ